MKLLVFTTVFPNSANPTLGVFVRERMFKVASHCEIKVVSPVPWFPLSNLIYKNYRPSVPFLELQEGIEVYHPRFFNFPGILKFLDGFFLFLSSLLCVMRLRRKFDFDLIDTHFIYPDGVCGMLLATYFKKPYLITVRESSLHKFLKYPLHRIQIKYALGAASKVITVCSALKEELKELGIQEEKMVVVGNGVDISKFVYIDQNKARSYLGIPLDKIVLISVGWLIERKGFHRIVKLLPDLATKFPNILYLIVGGSPASSGYESELRRLVADLHLDDHVIFAGAQSHDQINLYLSCANVFCLATSGEGWANVFLEAMACGLPVVTSRVGGNTEVVSRESLGLLFDLDDEKEMLQAIQAALQKNGIMKASSSMPLKTAGIQEWNFF